jgi:hypothetical protein
VIVEFEFDLKSFSNLHIHHVVLHVKVWYILCLLAKFN